MRALTFSLVALAALVATPSASAVETGKVERLRTEPGSVLVIRESQVYELKEGDAIFEGDRIFTRNYGAAAFSIGGCVVRLGGRQMVDIKLPDVCTTKPTTLEPTDVIQGIRIGAGAGAGVPESIGATPTLIGLLAAAGGAAAAANGGSDTPASP